MLKSFSNNNENDIVINIKTKNPKLDKIVKDFSFHFISDLNMNNTNSNQDIYHNIKESNVMIINQCTENNQKESIFIICFKNTLVTINQSQILLLKDIFSDNTNLIIYFMENSREIFNKYITIQNQQFECDEFFNEEINNFNTNFHIIQKSGPLIDDICNYISSCISGYLIKESYYKLNKKQAEIIQSTSNKKEPPNENFIMDDFIVLRNISCNESSIINLVYLIEKRELFIMKKWNNDEITKLINREYENYSYINYPLLPKLYGKIKGENCLIIQFINGQNLNNIERLHLTEKNKIIIIFEIMLIINYLQNNFVYRDLKPNNIIITNDKTIFLVDFDLMKNISDISNTEIQTNDFATSFAAPEVNYYITVKNDIYSIGQMIFFIMNERYPKMPINKNWKGNSYIQQFYKRCTNQNTELRPDIKEILFEFYILFHPIIRESHIKTFDEVIYFDGIINLEEKIITKNIDKTILYLKLASKQNYSFAQYILGIIYYKEKYLIKDIYKSIYYLSLAADQNMPYAQFTLGLVHLNLSNIKKAIHYLSLAVDQNYPDAQFFLGFLYYKGQVIAQDIDKAIQYLTLAADQNGKQAQYELGMIYYEDKFIKRDINKTIHYLTLASNQDNLGAHHNLCMICYDGRYIARDINKSIHYFQLASNQNYVIAQFNLGHIFSDNMSNVFDIEKAIHYYSLAANQNCVEAQYNLGIIYYQGQLIPQDIEKSIYYLSLASDQNYVLAQYDLGVIFYDKKYNSQDINKAIHYFSLAANHNFPNALFNLGVIYFENNLIARDIKKSINYLMKASNQNHAHAQYYLGVIYYEGVYITRNIYKAIHYLTLSSEQNIPNAQYCLGYIYYHGEYIKRDIAKALHFLTLASNQNYIMANYLLGIIYYDGYFIKRDIKKAIYLLKRAADQNSKDAHCILGDIYCIGKYVPQDINKSIYHYLYASKLNQNNAQYKIRLHYLTGDIVPQDITKGINFLIQSASNGNIDANFAVGYFYHEGKHIKKDIQKSIHYYKEASSFNNVYAKNNLGVIYKNGFGDLIPKNIGFAIEYFEEAIKIANDSISLYNLAHIYIFEDGINSKINDAINLILKSKFHGFLPIYTILAIALIKKHGFYLTNIEKEIFEKSNQPRLILEIINNVIGSLKSYDNLNFEDKYLHYKNIDYIYDFMKAPIENKLLYETEIVTNTNNIIKDLNLLFYEGIGINIKS